FRDYNAFANVQWLGSEPIKLTGLPEGGSFNIGELNPVTGDWEIDIAEAAANGLTFTPPEHFSGNLPLTLNVSVGPESDDTLIIQRPVLDPISFDTTDATGDEDTQISLSAAVTPTFVDDDGSETITSTLLSGVTVGHTITDGTNTFTATSGAQSVDVSSWDTSALTYFAGENVSGQFDLTVVVNYQDTGAGQTVSGSSSDTLTVNVLPVNDAPDAVDDQYILINGQTLVTTLPGVLSNDSDVENDTLTVQTLPVSGPSHGILTLNGDGSFIYVNSGDGSPTDQFTYSVSDGNGGVSTATVVLTIAPAPVSPPDANDDAVSTNEETPVTIAVLDNDQPTDAPVPIVQSVTQPANGAVVINANGTVTYTPDENFFTGTTDSFTYTIVDALDRTDTATVIVTVNNVQDAPTALPDSATTPEDVSVNINVLANDNDVDGDTLTIASATSDQGAVSIEIDGTLTFVPNANFSGPATINYTISDGNGNSVSSTVAVTVTAQPDAPDSADKTITIAEDSIYTLVTSDFVFSDGDDGDSLQYIDFQAPSVGTLSLNGVPLVGFPARVTLTQLNGGALTYQPETDGTGTAYATVDFLVSDGQLSDTAANTITFDVTPVDDPIALSGTGLPDQTLVDGETGVSLQTAFAFSDVDDVVATYALNGAPLGLQINANTGEITSITGGIDHLASNDSPFTATVTATSADGSSISTSFLIAVTNPAPVSTPGGDFEYNDSEVIVPIDIAALFSDPDLDSLTYALESGTLPENLVFDAAAGVLSGAISNAASTLETYTATFRATDEQGRSTTSSISFTINNPEPSLVTQIPNQNNFDGDVIDVAAGVDLNDFIQDDDALTFTVTGLPAGLTYDPATDIISGTLDTSASTGGVDGSYAITVVATDAQGRDTEANFTWNVVNLIPVIDAPIADQEAYDGDLLSFPLTDVFSDPDMDGLTFSVLVDDPAIGTVTLSSASGSPVIEIDVAPSASQTNGGIYLLTITADDGEGGATSELVQITISNPPPVIETLIPDQDSLDVDVISLDVSANFADVDGDTVTFSATGLASLGLSIDANGLISGTIAPSASQNSPYPITITATDADGGVGEYSFVWTVINPVPTAGTIPTQVAVDGQSVSFDAATAGGFADEDVLAYAVSGLPAGFAIDANGVITGTFSNAASTNAPYTVSVTATDNEGGTVVRSFTWSVTNPAPQTSDLPDQAARDGDTVAYDIAASFADTAPDTDLLSFSTTSPLPAGLSLSATGQLTGTLDHLASDGSPYVITVTATDAQGATINNSFTLTVTNPAPVVAAGGIADQDFSEGQSGISINAGAVFSDADGALVDDADLDTLTFDVTGLPAGLDFDPDSGLITGDLATAPNQNGTFSVTVTATDQQGASASTSFIIGIENEAPVIAADLPDQTYTDGVAIAPFDLNPGFTDPGAGLTLSLTSGTLPAGLSLVNGVITGTPALDASQGGPAGNGIYTLTVVATDADGETSSPQTLTFTVINPVPTAGTIPTQVAVDGQSVSF
ncbi:MAG: beta strand repeat-containing protein, partial [Hoeflea sp.]|uniref:beta strand repeat-containing protein n=1 Tax=Hoeflea sp. TaxID=1940281 RepID=UPI003EF3B7D6